MGKTSLEIQMLRCERCGHEWIMKNYKDLSDKNLPNICPKCKSKSWNIPKELCSNCGKEYVYGKYGICKNCKESYMRLYRLVQTQVKYQRHDYPIIYKERIDNHKLIQWWENKFVYRKKDELFKILGKKCYICGASLEDGPIHLHHIRYLGLKSLRKDLNEYSKFVIPLCVNHHNKVHSLTNRAIKEMDGDITEL